MAGFEIYAGTEYWQRHNNVAKLFHQALTEKYGYWVLRILIITTPKKKKKTSWKRFFLKANQPLAKHLGKDNIKTYWDKAMITIHHNKPDIIPNDKQNKTAGIVDIVVPKYENVWKSHPEKLRKCQDLAVELKK